jgi:hypothetical protein
MMHSEEEKLEVGNTEAELSLVYWIAIKSARICLTWCDSLTDTVAKIKKVVRVKLKLFW